MEKITCTAPIGMADLKRKFTEDVEFVIDYEQSKFKGKVLITYLSNLDITVRLKLSSDPVENQKLLADYLRMPAIVNVSDLEELTMNVLLAFANKPYSLPFDPSEFIVENQDILEVWSRRLHSLPLYAMYTVGTQYHDFVHGFPEDKDDSVVGVNFVNLIKHPLFVVFMEGVEESSWTWNHTFFTDYMFSGNNLFKYFAIPENPLFITLLALQDQASYDSLVPLLNAADVEAAKAYKELSYVPSV